MAEMYCSSHRSKPVSERNPQGVKGSIVQVDGRGNYKGVGMRGANELYGDSEAFSLACTPNRDSSARYELEAQLYVLQQKLDTERVLWQVNGNGGTGSGKGVPMYTACIVSMVVHRNDEEANTDDPSISIWSCTLPGFPKFLFREDLVDDAVHVYDSKPAATSEDDCALHDDTDDEAGYNGSDKDNDDDDPTTDDTDDDEPATAKEAKIVSSSKSTIASSTAKKQKSMMDFFRSSNIISPPGAPSDEAELEDNSLPRSLFNE
jgi:hypothetical protein